MPIFGHFQGVCSAKDLGGWMSRERGRAGRGTSVARSAAENRARLRRVIAPYAGFAPISPIIDRQPWRACVTAGGICAGLRIGVAVHPAMCKAESGQFRLNLKTIGRVWMRPITAMLPLAFLALAACDDTVSGVATGPDGYLETVPPEVAALAAPDQNLQTVQLRSDGCYWYLYEGPVETLMVPLRANTGGKICT